MTNKPTWDFIWMSLAAQLAKRSGCKRAHVGAVIASHDNHRVLAIGYNGGGRGMENTCGSDEPGNCHCLHAEENACLKNDYSDTVKKKIYTTYSPCLMCAKRIVNSSIDEVVYLKQYRLTEGIEYLKSAGIVVRQYDGESIEE